MTKVKNLHGVSELSHDFLAGGSMEEGKQGERELWGEGGGCEKRKEGVGGGRMMWVEEGRCGRREV